MKISAKRIVSLLLAVMLVCAMLTMTAGAADAAQTSEETTAAAATGDWKASDTARLRRLLPFQNLFYLRGLSGKAARIKERK